MPEKVVLLLKIKCALVWAKCTGKECFQGYDVQISGVEVRDEDWCALVTNDNIGNIYVCRTLIRNHQIVH